MRKIKTLVHVKKSQFNNDLTKSNRVKRVQMTRLIRIEVRRQGLRALQVNPSA